MCATRVCVVGSVNMDTIYGVGALPQPGETVLSASVLATPGGKGANQAIAAARAGARVGFVGAVGDDEAGTQLRRHLRANGVGTEALLTLPGPSAARAARAAGATVIVNAAPAGGDPGELAGLAAATDVLVVNETEADHWYWPVEHRVITRGARGARYAGADGELDLPAVPVTAVDTSGAGDAFAGALTAGWATGVESALRRACAAGALATLVPGAGDCAPHAEAIDEVLG